MLTFSEVPEGANGTAAAAAAWAQHGLAVELSGLARIERGALRLTVRGYPEWRRVDFGALRVRVLGARPPLDHVVLSLDVLMTGPWAGSRHAIDPHGLCLSFGNARLPTALGPLGDEPDEPDGTEVAPEAEEGGARVGEYAAVGPDLHWSATTFTADDVAVAAGECRRRDGACELRSRVPSYGAVRSAPTPSRTPTTVDEEEEEEEAAAGVRVLLGYGAARDANATNASVATYVRIIHQPRASSPGAVNVHSAAWQEYTAWLPSVALPSRSWRRLQLSIVAGRLSLWYDDVRLVDGWLLNGWRPAASWRVGVHGSRGSSHQMQWIDNLQIASGALRSTAEVPVFLSRNGQQFEALASHTFGYRAPPVVSSVAPRTSAAALSTPVVFRGANFGGGTDYRCLFGHVSVAASFNASDEAVLCDAPPTALAPVRGPPGEREPLPQRHRARV
jgi:hypothetical protein